MTKTLDTSNFGSMSFRTENRAFCPSCRKPVGLSSIKQTADFYKTNIEEIHLLREKVMLHPVHNIKGELMICEDSLFALFEQLPTHPLDKNYLLTALAIQ